MNAPKSSPPWTLPAIPAVLTYTYPAPDLWAPPFQLQWDYQVTWPQAGQPVITILRYRSFQQAEPGTSAELVEELIYGDQQMLPGKQRQTQVRHLSPDPQCPHRGE